MAEQQPSQKEFVDKKEMKEKQLMINLEEGMSIPKALAKYLQERKTDLIGFGRIGGYLKALIDRTIEDAKQKEEFFKNVQGFIQEHFWAGVFLAKTKPDIVKISYNEIQKEDKKQGEKMGYFG